MGQDIGFQGKQEFGAERTHGGVPAQMVVVE